MALWSRLRSRKPEKRDGSGSLQEYVELIAYARENGFLQTSMPNLTEEQVIGSYRATAKSNGPVWALTLARMQLFSQARFQWTRYTGGERGDLFGSPELALLERPWPGGTTADLLARMELDVTTAGNSYTRRVSRRVSKGPNGRQLPDRLVRLNPDWVTIVMGSQEDAAHPAEAADVELVGYVYAPHGESNRAVLLFPDEVAHYAPYPDPDTVFLGMSWISPVIRDVSGDNLQTDHKRAFLRNAATPQTIIKFDMSVDLNKVKAFKELFEEEHEGIANAYKTLFLGGGADATVVGKDFQQIEFSATQGKGESRLASAAGVPPSWVGFSEGLQGSALNAGNFTSARRRLSDGTLQHLWLNASSSLEAILTPPTGASLWVSTRGIPFLYMDASDEAQVQAEEAGTIVKLVRDGFTPESAVLAVQNHDWNRLQHTGFTSVQLQPPSDGKEPNAAQGTGKEGPAPSSDNGSAGANSTGSANDNAN